MEKITSLIKELKNRAANEPHLEHLTFQEGELFHWSHTACAITYVPTDVHAAQYLLHEFGHALLEHADYHRDVELLQMERAAWDSAITLSNDIGIDIDDDLIEDSLDSYRDWLHGRSLCPQCNSTGIQTAAKEYRCLSCATIWKVNEAKTCGLRRYITKKRP